MTLNLLSCQNIALNPAPPLVVPLARIAAVFGARRRRGGGPLLPLERLGGGLSQVRLSLGKEGRITANETRFRDQCGILHVRLGWSVDRQFHAQTHG